MNRCTVGTRRNPVTKKCEPCPNSYTRVNRNCVKLNMDDYEDPESFTCAKKRCPPKSRINKKTSKCEKCPPNRTLFKNRCYLNKSRRRSPIVTHIPQTTQVRRVPHVLYGHHH
jgi:hypothetical protein